MKKPDLVFSNNKVYDVLKYMSQIALPAVATLYFTLSQIWGLPNGEEVIGSIVAFSTFLGILLGVSSNNYYKSDARYDGTIHILEDDHTKTFSLDVKDDPYELEKRREVVFKVDAPDG